MARARRRSATWVALEAADVVIEAALQVPLPPARRTWSGLVERQAAFHRKRL